ncbi:hypothetical protein KP79_PYT25094 [Mizuhopecten yessoensis]|uniref:NXPE C-terminal domain-containing protein n=1 Tax=Mizuhopecten yessoensis TaxID=6573 RepID=A0A210PVM2_MIZYE|nr:hypothetical protein KP79_PYT25094 [Mizuhopecten yessoensis]
MAKYCTAGFLYRGVYHNLICRPTIYQSRENYRTCLKERPVFSIGDSTTTRQWFFRLSKSLQIKYSEGFTNNKAWQRFAHAYNTTLDLDVEWQPHELPFHGSPGSDRTNVKSVAYRLNRIPGNSSAIVIIHW